MSQSAPLHTPNIYLRLKDLQGFGHSIRILLLPDLVHLSPPQKLSLLQLKQPGPLCASCEARLSLT